MNDGLKDHQRNAILEVLNKHPKIERAVLFGSRAMGTFTPTSDIDIALYGDLTLRDQARIADELEQLSIPYTVDLVRVKTVTSPDLIEHIKKHGRFWLPAVSSVKIMIKAKSRSVKEGAGWGMADEWPTKTIDELKAKSRASIAIGPFGSRMKSDCYVPIGVPVIRGTNISDTRVLVGELVYITPEKAEEVQSSIIFADDLFFPHRGSIGLVGIVPSNGAPRYVQSSSMMKLTCDRSQVEPLYLFYFFRSARGRQELLKNASTVGTPGIGQPLSSLKAIHVPCPPLAEQKAIAAVLGSLDDKIELNRRMNATLEAMARALFQSWFVDFDPVRAKLDGRQPIGIDKVTAALFPDHLDHGEHGMLPIGWRHAAIEEICAINACTLGKNDESETLEYVEISEVSRGNIADIATYPRGEEPSRARRRLRHGDTVLSTVRPDRGSYFLALNPPENRVASTGFAVLTPTKVPWSFIHAALTLPDVSDHLGQMADGGAYPAVRPEIIGAMQNALPSEPKILEAFHRTCAPLFEQAEANRNQSRTLANLRDTLLPKLLSGEMSMADLESRMEAIR